MSKYIRTKDGRIIKHPHPNSEVFTFRYEIEKEADTIEELCDEFVINGKLNCYGNCYKSLNHLKSSEVYELDKCIVYGAIWTDKGLIYIAKMNNKRELELL